MELRIVIALDDAQLDRLTFIGERIMSDLTQLQATINALDAKVDETTATLVALAQAIVDLKASGGDVQAGIDALAVQAQAALNKLTAAEDAADDHTASGTPTGPT